MAEGTSLSITDEYIQRVFQRNDNRLVESVNAFSGGSFFNTYCHERILSDFYQSLNQKTPLAARSSLEQWDARDMKRKTSILNECLDLIEQTSKSDYDGSGKKWSRASKRKEMLLPDMKYLIYFESESGESLLRAKFGGFVSFMITYEDGHEVIYIYEIHFKPKHQGLGYGGDVMDVVEAIGREVGVEKAMLTVFKSNARAVKWYGKRGYVEDEYSPLPKRFRNGTVKEPTYVIMSKDLRGSGDIGIGDVPCDAALDKDRQHKLNTSRKGTARGRSLH